MGCLEFLVQFFDIFIFTREKKAEAAQILMKIDPMENIFSGLLSKSNCFKTQKGLLKDLRVIDDVYEDKEIIVVDSDSFALCSQIDNVVPLMSWQGDANDCEMLFLSEYLSKLWNCEDVREINRKYFQMRKLAKMSLREFDELLKC